MKNLLSQLASGQPLDVDQATEAFERIMTGGATAAQIGAMLAMIQLRGATVSELVAAAGVMRRHVRAVRVPAGLTAVDTCGTGGDHANTFNISTAAAIVAAGAGRREGVVVAKHGNRSVTSRSGSSQVLEALGVKLSVSDQTLTRCLDEAGICFCYAPSHHPAMRHVAPVRQELGIRTLFNLLGPLTNPAGATRQVLGVFEPRLTALLAEVLAQLGTERAMVVHGRCGRNAQAAGLDELSTLGVNTISDVRDHRVETDTLDPASLGVAGDRMEPLCADGPEASARLIRQVLSGRKGPPRDIVCLNAAAVMVVGGVADDLAQGLAMAAGAIDEQAAAGALEKLVELTQADPTPEASR